MHQKTQSLIAACFLRFARTCAEHGSPFYERLAEFVATEPRLLGIAAHAAREPIPNVFFGAVHFLLQKGAQHRLREYYASIAPQPRTDVDLYDVFSSFCQSFQNDLIKLIETRMVQTNEVNRCAILAPAFAIAYRLGLGQPLATVEIGTSAGLNQLWDRYRIRYSDGLVLGDPDSDVHVECENRGAPLPTRPGSQPKVASRVGIDLNPIDLNDADDRMWLRSLVWPDHPERAIRLDAAVAIALRDSPTLIRGDALTDLPNVLSNVARQHTLCVYQSSVLYQFSSDMRNRFANLLARASIERPVWHVSAENEEGLRLFGYRHGRLVDQRSLASFDAHGRWICWEQ